MSHLFFVGDDQSLGQNEDTFWCILPPLPELRKSA